MRKLWLVLAVVALCGLAGTACAHCVATGSSPNWTVDVSGGYTAAAIQRCINNPSVVAGDTVNVPAGTYELEENVTIHKNIHLRGADKTTTHIKRKAFLVTAVASGANYPMISRFRFDEYGTATEVYNVRVTSATTKFRVTDNYFTGDGSNSGHRSFGTGCPSGCGRASGLVDNNTFAYRVAKSATLLRGDNAHEARTLGSDSGVYLEDNTMTAGTSLDGVGWTDGNYNQSFVFRYNTVTNGGQIGMHGPGDFTPSARESLVSWEIYNNTLTKSAGRHYWWIQLRAGTGVIFGNALTVTGSGVTINAPIRTIDYRSSLPVPSSNCATDGDPTGSCDGNHSYDGNTVYASGTATGGATDSMRVSGGLTPGAHIGQRLYETTHAIRSQYSCKITGNTATEVTCAAAMEGGYTWASGAPFAIRTGYPCYMQMGTLSSATGAYGTTGQEFDLSPAYMWNNRCAATNGGTFGTGASCSSGKAIVQTYAVNRACRTTTAPIAANRDYYDGGTNAAQTSPTSPFNGTAGTGYGPKANIPTTCTPGTGYWVTDEGYWDSKTNGTAPDGVLYKCTATNTWTPYYTPYAYPHPLRAN